MKPFWFLLLLAIPVFFIQCQKEEEGRFSKFQALLIHSQKDLDLPIAASDAQKRHDAARRQEWNAVLLTFAQMLERIGAAHRQCPPQPDGFSVLRTQLDTEGERLTNDMARIDPTGVQSGLLPYARRFVRHLRTVLPDALEVSCTQPDLLRSRMEAARRDLRRMQDYLDLAGAAAH